MHEMAITQNILSIVLDNARKVKAKRVKRVNLRIGELTNVVEDCLRFYFDMISQGTIAAGAELNIKNVPLRAKCLNCSHIFQVENFDFRCPRCKGDSRVISGRELAVTSIEVD